MKKRTRRVFARYGQPYLIYFTLNDRMAKTAVTEFQRRESEVRQRTEHRIRLTMFYREPVSRSNEVFSQNRSTSPDTDWHFKYAVPGTICNIFA